MSFNHPISSLVSSIKNGYLVNKASVETSFSTLKENVLRVLKDEGYISGYSKLNKDGANSLIISLKYFGNNMSVINEISVISRPSRRIYCSAKSIPIIKSGLGSILISTSCGVVSDYEAKSKGLGGELLLKIF